ncbi:MAG: hypothetical protein ACRDXX_09970 [Stackebrandtia sp.]
MTTEVADVPHLAESDAEPAPATRRAPASRLAFLRGRRLVLAAFLLASIGLMWDLWENPSGRHHAANPGDDQVLFEWMLGHTAHALAGGDGLLFSTLLNAPWGVNLMANTSVVAIGVVLAPVTLIFGAATSYALAMTLGLFGTAAGWHLLLHRHLSLSRSAAAVGGAMCAFGPSTVAHANGHLNFTALLLTPFILIAILRLREPGRAVRGGAALGALIAAQIFIGEEVVFLLALFMAVFVGVYALCDFSEVKALFGRYVRGLSVAAALALTVLAYPLWFQFYGPQSYEGIPWNPDVFSSDLVSFVAFPTNSLAGLLQEPDFRLRHNVTEENTFFGLPLLALAICLAVMFFRRRKALRAMIVTAFLFGLVSLGSQVRVNGEPTGVFGPYEALRQLPLFDAAIPTRFALVLLPVFAILVAYGLDRLKTWDRTPRAVWRLAVALALLPLVPTPPAVEPRLGVPEYITAGTWREHVAEGGTLVPVPLPALRSYDGQRWQEAAGYEFAVPLGAFIGPSAEGRGQWSGTQLPTGELIVATMREGALPVVADAEREQAAEDLRVWRADAVVLGPHYYHPQLEQLLNSLLGPGEVVDDVKVWDVDPDTGLVV